MITFTTGDIFQGEHEVLVNDVNCAGNMDIGAGAVFGKNTPTCSGSTKSCAVQESFVRAIPGCMKPAGHAQVHFQCGYAVSLEGQGGSGLGHQVLSIDSFPDRRQEGH